MDTEKVIQDLNKRFQAPLPEYYKRRVVFWLDEEREFEDRLDDIVLDNAKITRLTGGNQFAIKKLLGHDDPDSNFVVYCPVSFASLEDNWLLDVQLYSEEFRADLVSIWMDEMHIHASAALRKLVKTYRKFFNAKERRERITSQGKTINTPAQLHLAVMATVCGVKDALPQTILRAVLVDESIYAEIENYGAKEAFWQMAAQATGYDGNDLSDLAVNIMLTACTRTMKIECLAGLERFISMSHQAWCFDFVSDWLHSEDKQGIYELARAVEDTVRLKQRFDTLSIADLLDTECFPCVNECILEKLMQDTVQAVIQPDVMLAVVEKRRTCTWFSALSAFFEGLQQIANMQVFYKEHAAGFHIVEPRNVWKAYTADYYRMDTYYRRFHMCYEESLKIYKERLNDLFAHVTEKAEGLYVHWFLEQLGENWCGICEDDLREYGYIQEVPEQEQFYIDRIAHADTRVFVIVSDALRYEVAAGFVEQLKRDTQSKVELSSIQAMFPTVTKFGMAALLPHRKLTVERKNGGLAILADGQPTNSGNRDEVLKSANSHSVALQYKSIIGMKRAERTELVKGNDVVYIYHDTIDEAGHASETKVFGACDTALEEIKTLIRIIVNEFSGTRIFITADHGFLYTYEALREDDKVGKFSSAQQIVEVGRRYAVMEAGANPDYLMPVKLLDETCGLRAFTPRENTRIMINGAGLNFVHGGVSLQEMVVPVISYQHLRNQSKEYLKHRSKYDTVPVTVSLLSASRKVSNMIFSLNFYQKEAVKDNHCAQTYLAYFTDEYAKPVSDVQKIIADKTGADNQDRTFRCTFNLKQLKYDSSAVYYLVIADEQGLQIPQRTEFQIDIAFAVDEFDFFA